MFRHIFIAAYANVPQQACKISQVFRYTEQMCRLIDPALIRLYASECRMAFQQTAGIDFSVGSFLKRQSRKDCLAQE